MGRFETEWLASDENRAALAGLSGQWIDCVHGRRSLRSIVLDMDSSVSPTHGDQEGTAYNGHFACTCYHPLFVFNQFGDLERCALRPGNLHSADGWKNVLEPVVARYRERNLRRYFRADAAFANPEVYEFLEAEDYKYTIRLLANRILQDRIGYLLKRPVGHPPNTVRRSYASFSYQAASWTMPRRVVAKVEWHPGELYPRVGFIVTNLSRPTERVVAFYKRRGTCEQWIKEGKNAIKVRPFGLGRFRDDRPFGGMFAAPQPRYTHRHPSLDLPSGGQAFSQKNLACHSFKPLPRRRRQPVPGFAAWRAGSHRPPRPSRAGSPHGCCRRDDATAA